MTQFDLFNRQRTPQRELGERAGVACAEKAELVKGFDLVGARARALELLARHGQMSGEDLVEALKREGFRGHDDRCFGPVFSVLAKHSKIRCVGFCARRRGHGTAGGRIWSLFK